MLCCWHHSKPRLHWTLAACLVWILFPELHLVTRAVQLGEGCTLLPTLRQLEVFGEGEVSISHMAPRTHPMQSCSACSWPGSSFHAFPLHFEGISTAFLLICWTKGIFSSGDALIQLGILTEGCFSVLWVFLCATSCHNVWESPLSLFLKDRFLFTSQLQAGSAHRFI